MLKIAIVGDGAAAVAVASALAESGILLAEASLTVVSPSGFIGPGRAYGASSRGLILNSRAVAMSIGRGRTFLEWCGENRHRIEPHNFAARTMYGAYLADEFARLQRSWHDHIRVVRGTADDVEFDGRKYMVHVSDRAEITVDVVVIAVGPPCPKPLSVSGEGRIIQDPWAMEHLGIVSGSRVLLVGTGLTMIDVAVRIGRSSQGTRMVASSRTGRLPATHTDRPLNSTEAIELPATSASLSEVIHLFRKQLRSATSDVGWQGTVDSWRPAVSRVWESWTDAERSRFQRHVARLWEAHRHRVPPQTAKEFRALIEAKLLSVVDELTSLEFDVVVNCTGPARVSPGTVPAVVTRLIERGLARLDQLEMGLAVNPATGRLVNGSSSLNLYVVGALRRGTSWETTSIPEIRNQAQAVAKEIDGSAR